MLDEAIQMDKTNKLWRTSHEAIERAALAFKRTKFGSWFSVLWQETASGLAPREQIWTEKRLHSITHLGELLKRHEFIAWQIQQEGEKDTMKRARRTKEQRAEWAFICLAEKKWAFNQKVAISCAIWENWGCRNSEEQSVYS